MKLLEYEMSNVTLLWFLKGTVFEETRAEAGCFCERKSVVVCTSEKILAGKKVDVVSEGLPGDFIKFL